MIPFEQLFEQNHKIAELAKVLDHLIVEREMVDLDLVVELYDRYWTAVSAHIALNEKHIYPYLLSNGDEDERAIAIRFLDGEQEIKKNHAKYAKKWIKKRLYVDRHLEFVAETREMFDLIWNRIISEAEGLYPAVRKLMA